MKRRDVKSSCPVNYTLEIFGDAWSLLIIRDMAAFGKKTFGEFLNSEERIGPSVLADRLSLLEQKKIILKKQSKTDGRKAEYELTEHGISILPVLYDVSAWGTLANSATVAHPAWFRAMELDRTLVIEAWQGAMRAGSSFYNGPRSVVATLNLA